MVQGETSAMPLSEVRFVQAEAAQARRERR